MHHKRYILKNNNGISTVLETLVTVAISLSLLIIFFVSVNNIYRTHDRPDADVEAKSIGVMEALTNNPGLSSGYNLNWEDNPENASFAGLGTTPTIAYGIATGINPRTPGGEVTFKEYHLFPDTRLGIATTCFLAGTKIVMADGTYRSIEDIKVGDSVKSFDEKRGGIVDRQVTSVFHHTADEMTPYYLIINKCLRITPNHQMYSDGRWIFAGDLKIGDCLFSPNYNYKIYSIEKIFEKEPTYNFEVDGNHNYFVALDKEDALVHNVILKIYPRFTWFDSDGAYNPGASITFNAEESWSPWGGTITYIWDWYSDGTPDLSTQNFNASYDFGDNSLHKVTLEVVDGTHTAKINHTVQANTPNIPEPDVLPWALTGKNIYPSSTLASYAGGYYVDYEELNDGNYFFEIKEKTNAPNPILDFQKIENLPYVMYPVVKTALGIDTSEWVMYNFNIMVTSINKGIICNYGASYENADILKSTEKEVLIYYKPEIDKENSKITAPPYYEKGRITVRVFIGGIPPNYPPEEPSDPSPANNSYNVPWTVTLRWKCYDPDGDPLKYDVYFKENDGDFDNGDIVSHNQTGSSYTPDIIEGEPYWWQIVAWDTSHNYSKGPKWTFTIHSNSPPDWPINPDPGVETEVEVYNTQLSWTGIDQDLLYGDRLTYDVHFGDVPLNIPKKVANQTDDQYVCEGRLNYNKKYYWLIKPWDHPPSGNSLSPQETGTPHMPWDFTTKEKGLDQQNTYSSSDPPPNYNTKDHDGLGQRFIIGSLSGSAQGGYLTKINLSLKYYTGFLPETPPNIWVQIYSMSDFLAFNPNPNTPSGRKYILAQGNITGFTDINFGWRAAILDKPLKVKSGEYYVIVIPKINTTGQAHYGWQYNEESMTPNGYYPRGEPWQYTLLNRTWWRFPISQDFLFKTYVIRIPFLNESSTMHSRYSDQSTRFELAQTFKAHYTGDLMKVNLSLNWSRGNPNQPSNLTVEIHQGKRLGSGELGELIATCTIKGFNNTGFVWKEATFYDNPPYLEAGEDYTIVLKVLNQGPQTSQYRWEKSDPSFDYRDGSAWVNIGGSNWKPIDMANPSLDFIFETYMDQVG